MTILKISVFAIFSERGPLTSFLGGGGPRMALIRLWPSIPTAFLKIYEKYKLIQVT